MGCPEVMSLGGGEGLGRNKAAAPCLDELEGGGDKPRAVDQRQSILHRTKICSFWLRGRCRRHPCSFAHGHKELRQAPDLTKTAMCSALLSEGCCPNMGCTFAHSIAELRVISKPGARLPVDDASGATQRPGQWRGQHKGGIAAPDLDSRRILSRLPASNDIALTGGVAQPKQLPALGETIGADRRGAASEGLVDEGSAAAVFCSMVAPLAGLASPAEMRSQQPKAARRVTMPPWVFAGSDDGALLEMVMPTQLGEAKWMPVQTQRSGGALAGGTKQGQMVGSVLVPVLVPVPPRREQEEDVEVEDGRMRYAAAPSQRPAQTETDDCDALQDLGGMVQLLQKFSPEAQQQLLNSAGPDFYED